jgi:acetyl esterase/lipase
MLVIVRGKMKDFNEKFSTNSQSTASKWVEEILRVVLYSRRKMSKIAVTKSLEKTRKRNENFTVPSRLVKKYNLYKYFVNSTEICVFNNSSPSKNCVFYLHGGGFTDQPLPFHYTFLNKLSKEIDIPIFLPIYPKAPNYTFEKTIPSVIECYKDLIKKYNPANITVMGDSAGGALSLSLAEQLKILSLPQPKHVIMLSPCLDISLSIENNPNMKDDAMFYLEMLKQSFMAYAGNIENLTSPIASPEFGDFTALSPLSIFIGTKETLYPYIERFMEKANSLSVDATCYKYHNLLHVFPLMPIPEAIDAREKMKDIIIK